MSFALKLTGGEKDPFRTTFARDRFYGKYAQGPADTWGELCRRCIEDVCGTAFGKRHFPMMGKEDAERLFNYMAQMKFIPGGRYLYYAGRPLSFWNNCFLMRCEEDSREEWSRILSNATSALMSGGGIGVDYSIIREAGRALKRTGGTASGPMSLMKMVNEAGRYVMQGGSRRSAMYASLNHKHPDISDFIHAKDWPANIVEMKAKDFNFPAPLDMTNLSVNWDTDFIEGVLRSGDAGELWTETVRQMMKTGEPGHSYNFYENENETLRNACGEVSSEDDSDVCNLGSINIGRIDNIDEFRDVCELGAKFLVCGSVHGDLPYEKVYAVRKKNRRIGLGIMGCHEWLLKKGYGYEVTPELHEWLAAWKKHSKVGANEICDRFYLNRPVKYRSIAPTGTIGILASTTTGIEPMFAVAYKRRYLSGGDRWKYEYVIDATAHNLIERTGIEPQSIETAYSLAQTPEKRVKFQFDVQKYVDHCISSTINVPAWGTEYNNEDRVPEMAKLLLKYCPGLRGITIYPDGSRGGQPQEEVPYEFALKYKGVVFDETEEKCKGGVCGI